MSQDEATLLALSRAEHEVAKEWFTRSLKAHLGTLVLTLIALFVEERAYLLTLATLGTEIIAWACRRQADRRHALAGDGLRRAALLDAFGTASSVLDIRDLRTRFSEKATQRASDFEDANYYASRAERGASRLRETLQESAFWSFKLYRATAKIMSMAAGALLVLNVLALLIVISVQSAETSLTVARICVVFFSFLVFSDVATDALAWNDAAGRSRDLVRRLESGGLDDPSRALAAFGEYSVATAMAPPIPSFLYNRYHDRIEGAWRSPM